MHQMIQKGFALALTMGIAASVVMPANAADYRDVSWHWAKKDIEMLSNKGVFVGYGDGTFRPNAVMGRAEFVTVLLKALGMQRGSGSVPFADVPSSHWAYDSIGMASSKRLIEGYPGSDFRPKEAITRQEALAILAKVTMGQEPNAEKVEQILKNYRDGYRVPDWSKPSVGKTIHYDVFKSAARNYNVVMPNERLTRAEAADMIVNLLRRNEIARMEEIEIHNKYAKVVPDMDIRFPEGIDTRRTKSTYTTTVATPISSEFTRPGDEVTFVLNEKLVTTNGITIAPGSKVMGRISEVRKAGWGETGMVAVDFDRISTPDGKLYEVKGQLATSDGYIHGNSNPAKPAGDHSLEVIKNQIKSESGAQLRHEREQVVFKTPYSVETSANEITEKNRDNFVLVGVGDLIEMNFTGPARLMEQQ